ncbi:MAG TPA: Uma2 family endonuclease [Myxococcaceae bacterium]|nr:Uma2 family endonuclease [Myxococcaceae bacterium]
MLQVPEDLLEERRRKGLDHLDEMWEGVLHMVPPPSSLHQELGSELLAALKPFAKGKGLSIVYELGVFRSERDYRVPDLVVYRADQRSERGVERGPEMAIELRSPNDETYEKLPFYESMGVREVFVIDPATSLIELFVLRGGKLLPAVPDSSGVLRSEVLGVGLRSTGKKPVLVTADGEHTLE